MSVQIDAWGVKRLDGSGEAVAWRDLQRVMIVTTDQGPCQEDFYWLLEGENGTGVAISGEQAEACKLLAALQEECASFNNEAVIEAASATVNERFLIWERARLY